MAGNRVESLGVFKSQPLMIRMTVTSVILFTSLVNKKNSGDLVFSKFFSSDSWVSVQRKANHLTHQRHAEYFRTLLERRLIGTVLEVWKITEPIRDWESNGGLLKLFFDARIGSSRSPAEVSLAFFTYLSSRSLKRILPLTWARRASGYTRSCWE
jgi:hypothetical protein